MGRNRGCSKARRSTRTSFACSAFPLGSAASSRTRTTGQARGDGRLSFALWRSEFGGRADVLGTRLRLDETEHLVIGVMPPAFMFPTRTVQMWTPLQLDPAEDTDRDNNYLHVLAELKPEMSLEAAQAEMNIVTERLERDYPKENLRTPARPCTRCGTRSRRRTA